MACCGKSICSGCMIAARKEMIKGNIKRWCPFCRVPLHKTDAEAMERLKKRVKLNDAQAHLTLGHAYRNGGMGLTQDINKTIELWRKAAELGSTNAHFNLATAYHNGYGVEQDRDKALQYWTLSAIGGDETGRYNLGAIEKANGNIDRAYKHWMIAARCGEDDSLKMVGVGYKAGHVTKEDYATTLRAYQSCGNEMKSKQRDIAAAAHDE